MQNSEIGQPNNRRPAEFSDQHGRLWHATTEMRTGHAVGPLTPMFTSPLEVESRYVKHDPLDSHKVHIDYQRWIRDVREATDNWDQAIRMTAAQMGVEGTISELIANPPPEILDKVGPRPVVMSVEVIQAAEAGNAWILHGEGEMPERAKQFFPDPALVPETTVLTDEGVSVSDPWAEKPKKGKGWKDRLSGDKSAEV